jgi:predicted ATPase
VFREPTRRVLEEQLAIDGPALPAKNPQLFVQAMLDLSQQSLKETEATTDHVFFDRGIPDVAAYAIRFGVDPTASFQAAEKAKYNRTAFLLPPWREIFVQDEFRGMSFEEYSKFHALICSTYTEAGYSMVEVPLVPVEQRVSFILTVIGSDETSD